MRNKKNNHGLQNSSRKFSILLAITAVLVLKTSAQTPTLGTYSNSTAAVGANTTVTPSATPTGATRINVSTNSNSKGVLTANTTKGVVRVTNVQPAGSYLVTIKAFDNIGNSTIRTFTLTVTNGTVCNATVQFVNLFTNQADIPTGIDPESLAIGDFNHDGKQDLATANGSDRTISIRSGVCYVEPPPGPCVFNNGGLNPQPLSESGVAAPAGFFWSELQHDTGNNAEANTVAGVFAVRGASRLADDFTIGQPCNLASVVFFGHEVDSSPNRSPFTSYTLQIWNGRPGDPGASVIFGDTTTNRLAYSVDSTYYRVLNSVVPAPGAAPGLSRKIWANTITINTTLASGTYWFDWDSLVTDGQNQSQETKTIAGSRGAASDNAR